MCVLLRIYKRSDEIDSFTFCFLHSELRRLGVMPALEQYYNKAIQKEVQTVDVIGISTDACSKLFGVKMSTGDIMQVTSKSDAHYYILTITGVWESLSRLPLMKNEV